MTTNGRAATGPPSGMPARWVSDTPAGNTPQESLQALIELAVRVGLCDAASITVLGTGGAPESVAFTDDLARTADDQQLDLNEGPGLDAARHGGIIAAPDIAADPRWPRWAPRATRSGVTGSVSLHLATGTAPGSLNLYTTPRREHHHVDIDTARTLAAHASTLLGHARTVQSLWRAIESRNLIGQAQGILMARHGLTADDAFAVLRRYSQNGNTKLVVLARELTTTGRLPHPDQNHPPAPDNALPAPRNTNAANPPPPDHPAPPHHPALPGGAPSPGAQQEIPVTAHTPERLLTPGEVALMFRVDPKTVTRWASSGRIASIRTPGGHRRYRETDINQLLADRILKSHRSIA